MTIVEAARAVKTNGCKLLRLRKGEPVTPEQFDVKDAFSGKKKGWFYMDAFTASAIVAVYEGLNEQNRLKYLALPLPKLVNVTWKLVK